MGNQNPFNEREHGGGKTIPEGKVSLTANGTLSVGDPWRSEEFQDGTGARIFENEEESQLMLVPSDGHGNEYTYQGEENDRRVNVDGAIHSIGKALPDEPKRFKAQWSDGYDGLVIDFSELPDRE